MFKLAFNYFKHSYTIKSRNFHFLIKTKKASSFKLSVCAMQIILRIIETDYLHFCCNVLRAWVVSPLWRNNTRVCNYHLNTVRCYIQVQFKFRWFSAAAFYEPVCFARFLSFNSFVVFNYKSLTSIKNFKYYFC